MPIFIHQRSDWPDFIWDNSRLIVALAQVRSLQGILLGKMSTLGFDLKQEAFLETVSLDVLKSTEIEGEFLHPEQVRSSVARHLGMDIAGLIPSDRHVDGVVEMILDATRKYSDPLSPDRLFGWHAALFPTGRSGMHRIRVGEWRNDETGPMQVVSGAMGKERVHFQAPDAARLPEEMQRFCKWFNEDSPIDPVIKAGVAHIWFISIHPFDDGNGRIARAITDMQLSKSEDTSQRFYSMSAQIRIQRNQYYDILEKTQRGDLDISEWLLWFLECMKKSLESTNLIFERILIKAAFWDKYAGTVFNSRQILMINKLLGHFEGKLNTSKWAKMTKSSQDTALRDIQDLVEKGVLVREEPGGRSTHYQMNLTL